MEIILAKPRGFCAGVKRAITIVQQALERYGAPVYVLHEIVHNTHVIKQLADLGAVFVENLEEVPRGSATIFSAHGVSLDTVGHAGRLGLRTIDATCPLVSKVHRRVTHLHEEGYEILVIGHKGHPEVEGTVGQAPGMVRVVSTVEEVRELPDFKSKKIGYVTQTTLSVDDANEILAALRVKYPHIDEPERTDICYATTNRQNAVRELSGEVELLLVVGSKNSSNSNRLREVALYREVSAKLIDCADEIEPDWLEGVGAVGVTAGASAPEHLVAEVIVSLKERYSGTTCREMEGENETVKFNAPLFDF
ncbi:MAG: 4-hydroxy-3-methylbut-2-enyl diphosphate reductase [Desulfobulbaceae bacterium]|nr:4-hydroxy-3-methylbut-2-enyl diphosphate reductase [Desulfobulbaceae bacterium]